MAFFRLGRDPAAEDHSPLRVLGQLAPRGGRADIVVTALVVAVVFAMLLPVPTWLLDVLIAINLCASSFLLVLVMQIQKTTGLSAFPSLFLVTTLFRVALSIASTRQILLNAEAGHIIEAFGEIVVGGNLVVGLVIFLVLTVVQFIVITKGSERVAEVGARFSLDAMPGRQMTIDMERKSGGITPEEARAQREALTEESQFFGAMDGTMKFAKGDAIVGIVIVLVNLLGGLTIGMLQRGMDASEALRVYAILTVGDGLVAQIPALLMSLCAGLLVTRVAKPTGGRNIGNELTVQLLNEPKAWVTASGAMVAFGLLPGMPTAVFLVLGAASATVGLRALVARLSADRAKSAAAEAGANREFSIVRPFVLRVCSRLPDEQAQRVAAVAQMARNDLVGSIALITPRIEVDRVDELPEGGDLEFLHGEVRVFTLTLHEGLYTFSWPHHDVSGLGVAPAHVDPQGGRAGSVRVWMGREQVQALPEAPADLMDCWTYLHALVTDILCRVGPNYFGIEEAQRVMAWTSANLPEVAKELERALPMSRLAEVLRRLLSERVSVRNLPLILNALIDWGPRERDPAVLAECIRAALQREICDRYARRRELRALMMDTELESLIRSSVRQTAYGDFLALDTDTTDTIVQQVATGYLAHMAGEPSLVVVCAQDIRPHVRKLLCDRLPELAVIGVSELPADYRVNVRTVISVDLDQFDLRGLR